MWINFFQKTSVISFLIAYLFLHFSFLENSLRQNISFSLFFLSIGSSIPVILFILIKKHFLFNVFFGIFIILYIFFAKELVSPPYLEYGQNKFTYLIIVILLGVIALPSVLQDRESLSLLIKGLWIIAFVFSFLAIFSASADDGRRGATGLNPMILSRLSMILGLLSVVSIFINGLKLWKVFFLGLSILSVFFTATKSPLPIAIISFLFVFWPKFDLKNKFKLVTSSIIVFVFSYLALIFVVPKQFSDRILNVDAYSVDHQSIEGNRLQLWEISLNGIFEYPLGIGLGGFANHHRFITAPHNWFLEIGFELGVFALVISILFVLLTFIKTNKLLLTKENQDLVMLKTLMVYSFLSLMLGGEITIQAILFYISAVTLQVTHSLKNKDKTLFSQ